MNKSLEAAFEKTLSRELGFAKLFFDGVEHVINEIEKQVSRR